LPASPHFELMGIYRGRDDAAKADAEMEEFR
jgi:hypothetical protein